MFECHITKQKQDNQKLNVQSNRSPIFNNPKRSLSKPRIFKNKPLSVEKMDSPNIMNYPVNTPLINSNHHNAQYNTSHVANLFDGRTINTEQFKGNFASNGLSHLSYIQKLSTVKINQNQNHIQMQSNYRANEQIGDAKYCITRQPCIKKQTVRFNYETPKPNHYFQPRVTTQAASPSRPPNLIHSSVNKNSKCVNQTQNSSKIKYENITVPTPVNIKDEQKISIVPDCPNLDEKKNLSQLDQRLKQFIIENKLEKQLKIESNHYCFMDNILNNQKTPEQNAVNCLTPPSSIQQLSVNNKCEIQKPLLPQRILLKSSMPIISHHSYNPTPIIYTSPTYQIAQNKQIINPPQLVSCPLVKETMCYVPGQQSLFKPYIPFQQLNQVQTHYIHPQQVIERQAILRNSNSSKQKHKIKIESPSSVHGSIKNDSVKQNQPSLYKNSVNSPPKQEDDLFPSFKKDFIHYSAQPYSNEHFPEQFCSMASANFRNSTRQNNYDSLVRTSFVSVQQFGLENKVVKRSMLSSDGQNKSRKIIIQPQYFKPLPEQYENNRYFDQIDKKKKKVSKDGADIEQISAIATKKEQEYLKYQAWSIKSQESVKKRSIQNSFTNYLGLKQQEENSIKIIDRSDSFSLSQYKQCNNNQEHFHDLLEPISPIPFTKTTRTQNSKQLCKTLFNKQRWETRQLMIVLALIGIGLSLILFQVFK